VPTEDEASDDPLPLVKRPRSAARGRLARFVRAPFGDVPGPLPAHRPDTSLEERITADQERGMRAFWWDGFWANSSETIVLNYTGLYLLAFGASNAQVGLLAALSSLSAALAFVPGARASERFGRRKALVLWTGGGIARVAMLMLAVVPFFTDGNPAIWTVIVLVSFRGFWGYFAVPAWTSLTADIVPLGIRGRFLASRNFGMGISALATAPLAGYLIDRFSGLHGWQLVWLLTFVAGALSTWAYSAIPEPAPPQRADGPQRKSDEPGFLREVVSDGNFVAYLVSVAVWNVALMAAGPFFNVYLVEKLRASTAMVGLINAIISMTGLAGVIFFGRMMDRRGTKWVLVVSGLLIPLLPAAWLFVTAPWQVIFINLFGGAIWAGYTLGMMNMVMVMAPPEKRARYAAAYQTVTFAAAFAGPLLGGYMIDAVGFKAVFAFSAVGRLASTLILIRFVEQDPGPRVEVAEAAAGVAT
jgi:MFS family permease